MRRAVLPILFLIGTALAAVLAVHAGLAGVGRALAAIGWSGLALVCLVHLVALGANGLAWTCVADRTSVAACLAARWIRDGASNLMGFVPAIGEVIGARALTLFGGASGQVAAASSVVDVAAETLAQALYTVIGFALLAGRLEPGQARLWLAVVVVAVVPLVALFLASRHARVLRFAERVGGRIGRFLGFAGDLGSGTLAQAVEGLNKQPGRVAAALGLHVLAWSAGAAQVWAASRGLAHPLSLVDCFILDSLVYAARSAAFLVPWAAGVQEGAFLAVGAVIGVDAASAIALSFALRARDLVFGAPAIALWHLAEGRRFWTRRQHA